MKAWYTTFRICCGFQGEISRHLLAVSYVILFTVCTAVPADAHKVNIFAYAQDGKVYAEGYFADGTKCKNSVVQVIDEKTGEKLIEGHTDENGKYTFTIPTVTSLKLVLYAGSGHQNEYVLSEEEVRGAMPTSKTSAEKRVEPGKSVSPDSKPHEYEQPARSRTATNVPASSEEMEVLIGKVVDSKLQPVMRILVKLQEQSEKPGLTEIIGGIGYIIGIMGIAGYLKGRAVRRHNT